MVLRDYVRTGSRPRAFVERALVAAGVGAILLLAYGASDEVAADAIARGVLTTAEVLACALAILHASATTALVLPTERATGALAVLLTAPRSALSLALGVLLSRVFRTLTESLTLVPLVAMVMFTLGGVEGMRLARFGVALGAATLFGAAAGLLAGRGVREHRHASAAAVLILVILLLGVPFLLAAASALVEHRIDGETAKTVARLLERGAWGAFALTPIGAVFADAVGPGIATRMVPLLPEWGLHAGAALGAGLLGAVAVALTARRLGRETDAEIAAGTVSRGGPGRAPARGPGADEPPLRWKESRPPRKVWHRWLFRLATAGWVALVAWNVWASMVQRRHGAYDRGDAVFVELLLVVPLWLLVLSTFAGAATFLAEERERGSLDLLRVAPFGAAAYALARPAGTLRRAMPLAFIAAPLWVVGAATGTMSALGFPAAVLGTVLLLPAAAMGGFRVGAGAPTVRIATQRASAVVFAVMFAWPFLAAWIAGAIRGAEEAGLAVLATDPVAAMVAPFAAVHAARANGPWDEEEIAFFGAAAAAAVGWVWLGAFLRLRIEGAVARALDRE